MTSYSVPSDEPSRQRKARPWRIVTICGGLLLLVSFFVPTTFFALFGSGATESASSLLGELLAELMLQGNQPYGPAPSFEAFLGCALLLSLFLPGVFVAAASAFRLNRRYRWLHARPWIIAGIIAVTWLLPVACILFEGIRHVSLAMPARISIPLAIVFTVFSLSLIYLIRAMFRPAHRAHLAVAFEVGVLTLFPFGFLVFLVWFPYRSIVPNQPGEFVALAGVSGLLLGTMGEAKALMRRPWWGTIWRLVFCCLKDAPGGEGCCPKCEYNLFGLSRMRCPECGQPFTFEELGVSPEKLGFRTPDDA